MRFIDLRAQASGIKPENDHQYTEEQFLRMYPQFKTVIPAEVLESYLELTNAVVSERRFGAMWKRACGLFAAHMLTLWLKAYQEPGTPAAEVVSACTAAGVITSESADGVSYSMDTSTLQDLAGWADFKLTLFGVQYASLARLLSRGGMYVW